MRETYSIPPVIQAITEEFDSLFSAEVANVAMFSERLLPYLVLHISSHAYDGCNTHTHTHTHTQSSHSHTHPGGTHMLLTRESVPRDYNGVQYSYPDIRTGVTLQQPNQLHL